MTMMVSCFCILPTYAAGKADMAKANVKWDLKNNKKIKYKQYWYAIGVKKQTAKMTKYKITNADKPGYKQCTFTVTFNQKVKPSKKQVLKIGNRGKQFTEYGFCVVDYQTGKTLGRANDKGVETTWKWKHSKYKKIKGLEGSWIRYPRKSVVNVKIIYPENYKNLAIGIVGASNGKFKNAAKHWNGKIPFSKATSLYSKKDKSFAHFKRVK